LKTCGWILMTLRVFNFLSGYRMWGKVTICLWTIPSNCLRACYVAITSLRLLLKFIQTWILATWTSTFWRGPFSVLTMWMWMSSIPDYWSPFLERRGSITVLTLLMRMVKASNTLQNIFNPLISLPSHPTDSSSSWVSSSWSFEILIHIMGFAMAPGFV